jgi:hypothetical protein
MTSNVQKKKARTTRSPPPPDSASTKEQTSIKLQQMWVFAAEQHKQVQELNFELVNSNKRQMQEISFLQNEVECQKHVIDSQKKKIRRIEMSSNSINQAHEKTKAEKQQLQERLHDVKETVKTQDKKLSDLHKTQEALEREAFKSGVSFARQETQHEQNITLPDKLDVTTFAQLVKDIFQKVHKKKRVNQCAAIAATTIWNLYDGKCKSFLQRWTSESIRKVNPYRQAQEIAKVMDLSPGQLNLSGYKALRNGLESKNKAGLIPRGKGWLCSNYYVLHAMHAIETEAKK